MDNLKEQIQDFLLRLHFVNQSPQVGGVFVNAWVHGMSYNPGVTYHKQFADLCKSVGLPGELPKPEYPEEIWAAYRLKDGRDECTSYDDDLEIAFEGHISDVSAWCKANEGNYHHMGSTDRYFQTEQEMFEKWKQSILEQS
jgi:hypothetical protein